MIVDELRAEERDGDVERSARIRWDDDDFRLRFSVPTEWSGDRDDGSPFLTACLLQAMRRGEDLHVDAPVSTQLLEATETIQTIYHAWAPSLRRAAVTVAAERPMAGSGEGTACFFSRGVDSTYTAAAEGDERLTHLVFVADLDPIHDETTQAEEVRVSRQAAELLGRELVVARSNIRLVADPLLDWADLFGAGLAAVGQCLTGGIGSVLIPSSCDWATFGPCGSSPVLDPLFSTEAWRCGTGRWGGRGTASSHG